MGAVSAATTGGMNVNAAVIDKYSANYSTSYY